MTDLLPQTAQFQLKKLSEKHKQVAALLAQGIGRGQISKLVSITPEYVTMLSKQPLFMAYVKEMTAFTDVRLQALYEKGVDIVADLLISGTEDTKLRAAQTVLKAVGKDGTQEHTSVSVKFVVELPRKSASTADWEALHQPAKRGAVTIDQPED